MKFPNLTNALSSITAILASLTAILASLGCVPGATDFAAKCTIPWLPASWLAYVTIAAGGVFGLSTLIGKFSRPGGTLHSFFGQTAVIVSKENTVVGTVTPEQVAQK
jgi:uncharacterized membrane protein YphA (DoxX/SURF4 family)